MIEKLLDHAFQFLLVAAGISIILYSASKFTPYPLSFVLRLVRIIISEFDPKSDQRFPIERINAAIFCVFLVVFLLCLFVCETPSGLSQAVGGETVANVHILTIVALILLALTAFISPAWVWRLRQEEAADQKARDLFSHLENAGSNVGPSAPAAR